MLNIWDIIILLLVGLLVISALRRILGRRKSGGCHASCSGCGCESCPSRRPDSDS